MRHNVTIPVHSPILHWWPTDVWTLSSPYVGLQNDTSALATAGSDGDPFGLSFAFVGSMFKIDGTWFSSTNTSVIPTIGLTVDGGAVPVDLSMPFQGALDNTGHTVNVSLGGGNVTLTGVTWGWDTDAERLESVQVPFTSNDSLSTNVSWEGSWAPEQGVQGSTPYNWAVGRGNASLTFSAPRNATSLEIIGGVQPGAGSFSVALDPPIAGLPDFEGNTSSAVTDPTTLLYAITLNPSAQYTVRVGSTSDLAIHLSSWRYTYDCGDNCRSPDAPQGTWSKSKAGPIAGGVVGGVVALVALLLLCWYLRRRRRRRVNPYVGKRAKDDNESQHIETFGSQSSSNGSSAGVNIEKAGTPASSASPHTDVSPVSLPPTGARERAATSAVKPPPLPPRPHPALSTSTAAISPTSSDSSNPLSTPSSSNLSSQPQHASSSRGSESSTPISPLAAAYKAQFVPPRPPPADPPRRVEQAQDAGRIGAVQSEDDVEVVPPSYDPQWALDLQRAGNQGVSGSASGA